MLGWNDPQLGKRERKGNQDGQGSPLEIPEGAGGLCGCCIVWADLLK